MIMSVKQHWAAGLTANANKKVKSVSSWVDALLSLKDTGPSSFRHLLMGIRCQA